MSEENTQEVEVQTDDQFEVEIVDDTPEADRGRPRRPEGHEPQVPDDEELTDYSGKVQDRIKKLRFEYHEERRAKEEAERIREEAIQAAKKLYEENEALKGKLSKGEEALVGQAKTRVQAELDRAKAAYKQAYETGDTDAIIEAQSKISELSAQKLQYDRYKPKPVKPAQPAPEFNPQRNQPIRPDNEAVEWAERNPWFGKDKKMTSFAMGVHDELVSEGIDPRSQEYYERIDQEIRDTFPNRNTSSNEFDEPRQNRGTVVAPASRSSKSPRKITLTQTQVALAKRLGLSPEQYAAQLLKEKAV